MPREPFALTPDQHDRAVGALLGTAAGDALTGRGASAPGEWTDTTAMAIAVAEIASFTSNLTALARLGDVVHRWAWWARSARDVGPQSAAVLPVVTGEDVLDDVNAARAAAVAHYESNGRVLDATCLTRAVPAALANLGRRDEWSAAHAARLLCALTHAGPDVAESATLWTLAIRHAVRTGSLDLRIGLPLLAEDRREVWAARIGEAEGSHPAGFASDDVVGVVQAAWSAIAGTAVPQENPRAGIFRADHLRLALESALRGSGDGTVAAVAGGLLGAAYGASALPWQWRAILRGWPGLRTHGLTVLAEKIVNGGDPARIPGFGGWRDHPDPQRHPHDDGVWIGVAARLAKLPEGVDAVVSLCPISDEDMPLGIVHLEVRLDDQAGANPHLDFVVLDTVRAIEALRARGHTVFLHGRTTRSRAPAVAALYGARRNGIEVAQALADLVAVLPDANPTDEFRAALHRLSPATERSTR